MRGGRMNTRTKIAALCLQGLLASGREDNGKRCFEEMATDYADSLLEMLEQRQHGRPRPSLAEGSITGPVAQPTGERA